MGLCKCPKKKVTNLFCFEHRVNVCESCLVESHDKCVVQSYLQWLQDSDYNPNCSLCNTTLQHEECIRLSCYDIFHWRCLSGTLSQLPSNTAPAGYECPLCSKPVIPSENAGGPVVERIKKLLHGADWARTALGLPLMTPSDSSRPAKQFTPADTGREPAVPDYPTPPPVPVPAVRKTFQSQSMNSFTPTRRQLDSDENKYARRSAFTWLSSLLKSWTVSKQNKVSPRRRLALVIFLLFLAMCTFLYVFSALGRHAADQDPMLNPALNPHLRSHDEAVALPAGAGSIDTM